MRVEVLCTGDELLTGLTADTNSPYFMERLLPCGEQVARATIVGDVREEILDALSSLGARADVVLVSGGLGPTADDITAQCAALSANVPLVESPEALAALEARFARRGMVVTPNNRRQAQVPQGAEVVLNPHGSAPMFILQLGRATAFFVPGVPREYRYLVDAEVLPRIRRLRGARPGAGFLAFRLLRTLGLPESHLDARVAPVARAHPDVTFGFRTHAPENHLKLMARGRTQAEADAALAAAEQASRAVLGQHVFGQDDERYAEVLGALLLARQQTLALAESCTGGRIADLLTSSPGASAWFPGGAVVYANAMKEAWVQVRAETLAAHGAVSEPVAREMAEGVRRATGATWGLSVTGIAGPTGGSEDKPVGTVFTALAGPGGTTAQKHRFPGDREQVRTFSAAAALETLRRALLETAP
ncbi:MAG: competence/damage-inducible protein A [Myxococcaceae bacterium]